ncbi:MAG TPA: CehA/McbA family metallohydrolase [Polyangiaceae bacterium]|nr:CehA/McbA family metallohydrolase [Polyangiaceae bacterium]
MPLRRPLLALALAVLPFAALAASSDAGAATRGFARGARRARPTAQKMATAPRAALASAAPAAKVAALDPAMGRLAVRVVDPDAQAPLPARLSLTRADDADASKGTPSIVELDGGGFDQALAPGRYHLLAMRGLEYSVDEADVEVTRGETASATLTLRRAVDTPGWVACDFHTHSRGFDSPATLEARVQSLVAAGIEFAVPSEHNRVGSFANAPEAASGRLAWAPGIEVTTARPNAGHFNVFPYVGAAPPRAEHTTLAEIIREVRRASPGTLIQINHPRLGRGMGYFDLIALNTAGGPGLDALPPDFDLLEVYNGFELARPERTDAVFDEWLRLLESGRRHTATGDSDVHGVHPPHAGFPRTYVAVPTDRDDAAAPAPPVPSVVEGLRRGQAMVTSGPLLDVRADDGGPGETARVVGGKVRVRVRVRAAPWVDVRSVEVLVGGRVASRHDLPEVAPRRGVPQGSLAQMHEASVRFDQTLELNAPRGTRTVVVRARGERSLAESVPYLAFRPLAFSNPIYLAHAP